MLTKTIFGLEPARLILKCDVSELKDQLIEIMHYYELHEINIVKLIQID